MGKKAKILVIDDDISAQKMIEMALKRESYEVISAMNGKTGLEKAEVEQPDLIILDVIMQEKDGVSACKELKSNPKCKHIPIIIVTAVAEAINLLPEMQRTIGSALAEGYIEKPFDPNLLMKKVKKLIQTDETGGPS